MLTLQDCEVRTGVESCLVHRSVRVERSLTSTTAATMQNWGSFRESSTSSGHISVHA